MNKMRTTRYFLGLCLAIVLTSMPATAQQVPISEVGSELKGQHVEIVGRIANKIAPVTSEAPARWYLTDDEGAITVLLTPTASQQLAQLQVGQIVTVTGPVDLDRFSPVIHVSAASQIVPGGQLLTTEMKRERMRSRQATPRPPAQARPSAPAVTPAVTAAPTPQPTPQERRPPQAKATPDWAKVTPTPRFPSALIATPDLDRGDPTASRYDLSVEFEGFPDALSPEDLTPDMIGKEVVLTGKILKVYASRHDRMPNALRLMEEPREIGVVYYPDIAPEVERGMGVAMPGQMVSARGIVGTYKEQLQVRVTQPSDIVLQGSGRTVDSVKDEIVQGVSQDLAQAFRAAEKLPQITPIDDASNKIGQTVTIVGFVNEYRAAWNDRAPNILNVRDSSGSTEVVFWSDIAQQFNPDLFDRTTPVVIHGVSDQYRDRLQIKPGTIQDIQHLDPQHYQVQIETMAARQVRTQR